MQVLKVSNDSLLAPKLIENFTPNIKRHFAFSTIQSHTVQDTVWLIQTLVQVLMLFVDLRLLIRIDLEKVHWLNRRVRVPTRTGKPGKMGRHFPVREKSGNFEQTGKVRENHTKYWKTEEISEKNYLLFFNDI